MCEKVLGLLGNEAKVKGNHNDVPRHSHQAGKIKKALTPKAWEGQGRGLRPTVGGERIATTLGNWSPLSPRNSPCVLGMPCTLRCLAQGCQL